MQNIIDTRFMKKLQNRKLGNIGIELEFPLLNLDKGDIDLYVIGKFFSHFLLKKGFAIDERTIEGFPAFIVNDDGDFLSFDNSYNNFEFSMNYCDDLTEIRKRFYKLFRDVNEFFLKYNYQLTGLGTNPYKKYITQNRVKYDTYNKNNEYLQSIVGSEFHQYRDFPAYLSSIQTHLDVPIPMLFKAFNLFARLDFVRAILFSNSLDFDYTSYVLCYRDFLWEFGGFPNVGKVEENIYSEFDLRGSYINRKMYDEDNVQHYYSFKNVEITDKGTLEVRSDCTQPLTDVFLPPLFSLGVLNNLTKVEFLLSDFLVKHFPNKSNSQLRNSVIYRENIFDVKSKKALKSLVVDICKASADGLKKRGKGEEKLFEKIFERAENMKCPALNTIKLLEQGKSIEYIIDRYALMKD